MGNMRVAVDGEEHPASPRPGVSGTVVNALVSLIRSEAGEAGVAQALALASEERSFPILADADTWTPLADAAALFTAGALVTGDGAIARHIGEDLLWNDNRGVLAARLAALGSPEAAVRHIGALIEQFEGAVEAVTLEAEPGHALVQVTPVGDSRHAHLCELTRGLLSELPAVFDRERARITEHECAARGGRFCRYAMDWEPETTPGPVDAEVADGRHEARGHAGLPFMSTDGGSPANGKSTTFRSDEAIREAAGREGAGRAGSDDHDGGDHHGPVDDVPERTIHGSTDGDLAHRAEIAVLTEQLRAARAAVAEASANAARWEAAAVAGATVEDERRRRQAEADAARARTEISRLEHLLEGGSTPTLGLLERDADAVVAELGERADRVLDADRFLLMLRVSSGTPLRLHHRGLDPEEARGLAAQLWAASPDGVAPTIQVVDIASSMRRYGRLAVLPESDDAAHEADDRVLLHFARYRGQRARCPYRRQRCPSFRLDGPDSAVLRRAAVRSHQSGPGTPDPGRHRPRRDRVRPVHRVPVGPRPVSAGARCVYGRHDTPRRRPRSVHPPLGRRGLGHRDPGGARWRRIRQYRRAPGRRFLVGRGRQPP